MESEPFFKFPKTPHIAGSSVVDDDEVLSDLEVFSNLALLNNGWNSSIAGDKLADEDDWHRCRGDSGEGRWRQRLRPLRGGMDAHPAEAIRYAQWLC